MFNLKWTNKYSLESGYVKRVMKVKGHFENTANQAEAKKYRSEKMALKDIEVLTDIGEAQNNVFEVVEA